MKMVSPIFGIILFSLCCLHIIHGKNGVHNIKRLRRDYFYPEYIQPDIDLEYEKEEGSTPNDLIVFKIKKYDQPIKETNVLDTIPKFDDSQQLSKSDEVPVLSITADSAIKSQDSDSNIPNSPDTLSDQFMSIYLKYITNLIQHVMDMLFMTSKPVESRVFDESPNTAYQLRPTTKSDENDIFKRDIKSRIDLYPINVKSNDLRKIIKRDISKTDVTQSSGESVSNDNSVISASQSTPQTEINKTQTMGHIESEDTSTTSIGSSSVQSTLENNIKSTGEAASSTENKNHASSSTNQQASITMESSSITDSTHLKTSITNDKVAPKILLPTVQNDMASETKIHQQKALSPNKMTETKTEVTENLLSVSDLVTHAKTLLVDAKTINNIQQFELKMPQDQINSNGIQGSFTDANEGYSSYAATALTAGGLMMLAIIFVLALGGIATLIRRKRNNVHEHSGNRIELGDRTVDV